MAGISISGLASNLDTESIISSLMQIERVPRGRLELRQGQVKAREEALRDILARLGAVSDAAASLRSTGLWADTQTVHSSAPESVAARRLSGTGPGGYQIAVTQLARAEQRTYDFTPSAAATQITVGAKTIDLAANATLGDAVAAINGDPETGVYAVEVGGRLVLSSRLTGAANGFSASGATLAEDPSKLKAGLDAAYTVDGVPGSSESNVVTDAIPGLELTLGEVTAAVTVTVGAPGPDTEAVKSRLKDFVSAYNAAVDAIRARLTEKRVPGAGAQADANKGVLFGDTVLSGLLGRMREVLTDSGLDALGIGTGPPSPTVTAGSSSVLGHLTIDEAKLAAALEADPAGVRDTVAGPEGLADALDDLLSPTLGSTGGISQRLDAAASEAARIQDSMAALDTRLERREDRLRAQFAALERLLSQSQSQSEWLSGQLAGLAGAR